MSSGLDIVVARDLAADICQAIRLEKDLKEGMGYLIPEELKESLEKVWLRRSWDERQAVEKAVKEGKEIGVIVKSSGITKKRRNLEGKIDYVDYE